MHFTWNLPTRLRPFHRSGLRFGEGRVSGQVPQLLLSRGLRDSTSTLFTASDTGRQLDAGPPQWTPPQHIPGPQESGTASPDSSPLRAGAGSTQAQSLLRLLQCPQPGLPAPTQAQGPPLGSLLGQSPLGVHTPAAAHKSHLGQNCMATPHPHPTSEFLADAAIGSHLAGHLHLSVCLFRGCLSGL